VPGVTEALDAHVALYDLPNYSLAARDAETEMFLLHRMVLDVTRRGPAQEGRERQCLTEALGWVNAAFIDNAQDVRTWPTLDPLGPLAEAVAGYADEASIAHCGCNGPPCHAVSRESAAWARRTALPPRARHRRHQLSSRRPAYRDPPQQPRLLAVSHQPARRGGTADVPRTEGAP